MHVGRTSCIVLEYTDFPKVGQTQSISSSCSSFSSSSQMLKTRVYNSNKKQILCKHVHSLVLFGIKGQIFVHSKPQVQIPNKYPQRRVLILVLFLKTEPNFQVYTFSLASNNFNPFQWIHYCVAEFVVIYDLTCSICVCLYPRFILFYFRLC